MGKRKRGGIPDREKAARIVLGDWNSGKIKYFTHPPETVSANLGAEIVSQFAKEFRFVNLKVLYYFLVSIHFLKN